jgi:glycosyltransferase involved in cell wall biosynthesis
MPSTKYRILPFLPLFRRDGIDVEHLDIPEGLCERWNILGRVPEFDVVLLQKRLLPTWQYYPLRKKAKALVYDYDDPIVLSRNNERIIVCRTRRRRFRAVATTADALVCHVGSESFGHEYGARAVHTISTSVDLDHWTPKTSWSSNGTLTLGWLGTASNIGNLRDIAPALAGCRLKIVAEQTLDLPGVEVEFLKWDAATEAAHVRSFDIAVAPLPDDLWSRSKMPLKILHYFASAVPVVATSIGGVPAVIKDGENGLLAGDWKEKIGLLRDPAVREKLGRAGRATVEASYTVETAYAKLKGVLESVARR